MLVMAVLRAKENQSDKMFIGKCYKSKNVKLGSPEIDIYKNILKNVTTLKIEQHYKIRGEKVSEKIVAVDRALDILNYLFNKGEEAGISKMSRELDIPKSAIHRTLITLEEKNFVYKNKKTDKYWLGIQLYAMGELVKEKVSLIDIIKPYAEDLHHKTNEVVNVSMLETELAGTFKSIVVYNRSNARNILSVNPRVGSSADAHTSSEGKVLLAFNNNVKLEIARETTKLNKYTENTIDNWDDLFKELEYVREKGYAVDNEERELGLYCLGAPIIDKTNNAIAAISILGPTFRMKDSNLREKIKYLKEETRKINQELKHITL